MGRKSRKQPKRPKLEQFVRSQVNARRYRDSRHATVKKGVRNITLQEVNFVLKYGVRKENRDRFRDDFGAWTYAYEGKTLDGDELRIIVAIDESDRLVIVTAIDL